VSSENTPELKTTAAKLQPPTSRITTLERKLQAGLRRLKVNTQARLVIGVSGGADSMALVDGLLRLQRRKGWPGLIHVAHVNHMLRGAAAEADLQFVQTWAEQHELAFSSLRVDVAQLAHAQGRNWEATARTVRYDFFAQVANQYTAQFVCTAHTFDDQVETLLLRLLRGTGAAGLRGIHETLELREDVFLLRPMLMVTRTEVLAHCAQYGIEFRTDETNALEDFTRNHVRHTLLPLLHSFNPRFGETLVRTAAALSEDDDYLQHQALELLRQIRKGPRLRHALLRATHPALAKRVLRTWLQHECNTTGRADAVHLEALLALAVRGQGGSVIELPHGWRVKREGAWLYLWRAMSETDTAFSKASIKAEKR
jgi:tRNA(Ile)-lysidine synthase